MAITVIFIIMIVFYLMQKCMVFRDEKFMYSQLVEDEVEDAHKDCPEDDDPPMLLDDDYRLCTLMKKAEEMGLETTMDNLSEFRDSVRATKLHTPDDVYAQLDLV